MSNMHYGLKELDQDKVENFDKCLKQQNQHMREYFSDQGVREAMENKLGINLKKLKISNFQFPISNSTSKIEIMIYNMQKSKIENRKSKYLAS